MEAAFDELEPELRAQAAGQLRGRGADWELERRQGLIADELIAVAAGIRDARPGQNVVIVIGSSSHATHRMVGSARTEDPSHADRDTTVRSDHSIFPERPVVSPARPGSPVEVLLVGHSLDCGVPVGVVEGAERLVSRDGQLERSA